MEGLELSAEGQFNIQTQLGKQKNKFPLSDAELGTMQSYYSKP